MKILFVTLMLPQPHADHASSFTVYKVIKRLSQRHDISLISYVFSDKEAQAAQHVRQFCRRVETVPLPQNIWQKLRVRANLVTLTPIAVSNAFSHRMQAAIRAAVQKERFDIVELEYTPMAQYVSDTDGSVTVLGIQDVMFAIADRYVRSLPFSRHKLEWWIDKQLCHGYEPKIMAKFDRIITVSQKSKDLLLARDPKLKVAVVPPGVDLPAEPKHHHPGTGRNLIFMGAMWRPTNIDAVLYFYHSIFNRIRRTLPETTFYIVGGRPSGEVQRLASDPGVQVTGYVENIHPFYMRCDVSVVPMRIAGGIMCKVLDAMAAGLPVVTTSQGNEGVGARPGKEIIVADTPDEFAKRTIELLMDGAKRETLGSSGLRFVKKAYSWKSIIGNLENTYQACIDRSKETTARAR